MKTYQDINKETIDRWVEEGWEWGKPIEDESFDIVFHPISNCYIEDVQHVFNESYRVLKKGGIFLAGL